MLRTKFAHHHTTINTWSVYSKCFTTTPSSTVIKCSSSTNQENVRILGIPSFTTMLTTAWHRTVPSDRQVPDGNFRHTISMFSYYKCRTVPSGTQYPCLATTSAGWYLHAHISISSYYKFRTVLSDSQYPCLATTSAGRYLHAHNNHVYLLQVPDGTFTHTISMSSYYKCRTVPSGTQYPCLATTSAGWYLQAHSIHV